MGISSGLPLAMVFSKGTPLLTAPLSGPYLSTSKSFHSLSSLPMSKSYPTGRKELCKAQGPRSTHMCTFVNRLLGWQRLGSYRQRSHWDHAGSIAQNRSAALKGKHLYHLTCPSEPGTKGLRPNLWEAKINRAIEGGQDPDSTIVSRDSINTEAQVFFPEQIDWRHSLEHSHTFFSLYYCWFSLE